MYDTENVLDAITRFGAMKVNTRQYRLLEYLLQIGNDNTQPVSEYAIAVDVIGRDETFDPASDAIVRAEMCRLRKTLELFSLKHGRDAGFDIDIPRQSYTPVIKRKMNFANRFSSRLRSTYGKLFGGQYA